jgi:hypothetical protein
LDDTSECQIDAQGLAKVAGLNGPTNINVEQQLASATLFHVKPSDIKLPEKTLSRQEMEKAAASHGHAESGGDHGEDE